ncbi:polysaccharide biosynthesis C-terminal domain-containing protein, partial [Photobacterium damselae]|nr:polysaccharide biosynthesis C-terminal domain-containing protein [Photobacterium damselae]
SVAIMISLRIWNGNFSTLLNGLGRTKLQIYISFITVFLNIPLSILMVDYFNFGVEGIVLSTIICLSIFSIIAPIYCNVLITNVSKVNKFE